MHVMIATIFAALALLLMSTSGSYSMELRVLTWNGHQAVLGTGKIGLGDAENLRRIASSVPPAAHGYRIFLLNSPGGSVAEAFKMSEVMARLKMHAVVARGATCESACGAILFIAGHARTIEEGGRLGLHTCYRTDTGIASADCNERIALNAVAHGVSHGSLMAAMKSTPPEGMTMYSRKWAECIGLTKYPGTDEAGFERSEPCILSMITGREQGAQAAWRLHLENGGLSAFVRTFGDHMREGEIKIRCLRHDPNRFVLSINIPGREDKVREAIAKIEVRGFKKSWTADTFVVSADSPTLSVLTFILPAEQSIALMKVVEKLEVMLNLHQPYRPMGFTTFVQSSRGNFASAARHCPLY